MNLIKISYGVDIAVVDDTSELSIGADQFQDLRFHVVVIGVVVDAAAHLPGG